MGDLAAGDHLSAGESGIFLGSVDDQFLTAADGAAYIVGQAAAGVGDVLTFIQNDDFRAAVLPLDFSSGLRTGGHAANDQNTHLSSPSLLTNFCVTLVISIAPQYNKIKFLKLID